MRPTPENKAVTAAAAVKNSRAAKKCAHCGRPTNPRACRPIEAPVPGFYCQQWGLQTDPDAYISPSPDPIGKAEARAILDHTPAVEEARANAEIQDKAYEEAKSEWLSIVARQRRVPEERVIWTGGVPRSADGGAASREGARLADLEREALEQLAAVERDWLIARQRLQRAERALDVAATRGRLADRGQR